MTFLIIPVLGSIDTSSIDHNELRPWGCRTCSVPAAPTPVDQDADPRLLMISLLCGLGITVSAQKNNLVYRCLKDSISAEPVALASVTNMNTGTTVMTNYRGLFNCP